VSFNCFGQLGVKSGIIHSKSLESNVPYIQIDLADYNFSWLISTGINYSTFEQLLPIDSKKNVDVRTHRIGIQFRITSKNIESFIKKKN